MVVTVLEDKQTKERIKFVQWNVLYSGVLEKRGFVQKSIIKWIQLQNADIIMLVESNPPFTQEIADSLDMNYIGVYDNHENDPISNVIN